MPASASMPLNDLKIQLCYPDIISFNFDSKRAKLRVGRGPTLRADIGLILRAGIGLTLYYDLDVGRLRTGLKSRDI